MVDPRAARAWPLDSCLPAVVKPGPAAPVESSSNPSALSVTFANDLCAKSDGNFSNGLSLLWTSAEIAPDAANSCLASYGLDSAARLGRAAQGAAGPRRLLRLAAREVSDPWRSDRITSTGGGLGYALVGGITVNKGALGLTFAAISLTPTHETQSSPLASARSR